MLWRWRCGPALPVCYRPARGRRPRSVWTSAYRRLMRLPKCIERLRRRTLGECPVQRRRRAGFTRSYPVAIGRGRPQDCDGEGSRGRSSRTTARPPGGWPPERGVRGVLDATWAHARIRYGAALCSVQRPLAHHLRLPAIPEMSSVRPGSGVPAAHSPIETGEVIWPDLRTGDCCRCRREIRFMGGPAVRMVTLHGVPLRNRAAQSRRQTAFDLRR